MTEPHPPIRPASWPVVVVAAAVFAAVTIEVLAMASLTRLDHRVADWAWAANIRHGNLPRTLVVYAATMPGDAIGVCALVVPFVAWLAWSRRDWRPVLRLAVALATVLVAVWLLKHAVGRTQPGIVDRVGVGGRSFPSGHSAVAVVMAGLVAWLAADYGLPLFWRRLLRVLAYLAPLATAAGMVLLVYHWVTDVLAGLALGVVVLRVIHLMFAGVLGEWGNASRRGRAGPDGRHAADRSVGVGAG